MGHHGDIARIEIRPEEFKRLLNAKDRARLAAGLKKLGYAYITLDLEGYRTGSLNEPLGKALRSGRSCSR